ncbi:MAG: non-ribosomal peptide synthetase [Friedmanniella sp.]
MNGLAEADRDYWHTVLVAGGFSELPRWSTDPRAAVDDRSVMLPDHLLVALESRADELGVPVSSVLLAAHGRVLSALTGEQDVTTGYVVDAAAPLPCRLTTAARTWRELVVEVARAESELRRHAAFPVLSLSRELGVVGPLFEVVFDPAGPAADLADGIALRVTLVENAGRPAGLSLRHRTEVLDSEFVDRLAGYYLTALALLTADPDAEHAEQSLLGAEELRFQLDGLAGPTRELPDRRLHELFEEQARMQPDAVAASQGGVSWTYGELNARANRLARGLLARGLGREGVVAVVSERNLDWMAAVLAVFKAGGVYLPIEPHFPPARIQRMLSRAECRLVLAQASSTATLDEALTTVSGVEKVHLESVYAEDWSATDVGIPVSADQLAYIYFTSGSTGEPKGAMCEHLGMLNHVYAKIEDLEISAGQVVAQTAPQCFDISLWQLVSALLVGGQTLVIEQEAVLDVERFVDTVTAGRVAVLQVVPSYLEVVLSYLEQHPRPLPDLRYVSVTGEAVKKELIQRWFAARPDIKLVNAYGLTETSDDTNHEVMDRVPERDRVPLGRPIHNVRVLIVDDNLTPVPLGAPGAIVFSGICVGRGYVNDPERTQQAFLPDPRRSGERLYRGGDFGRWLPDGKLEFLGRRDHQVKIAGFRIEIGDIENALLTLPGVRDGAVVVAERPDQSKQLVAFYSAAAPLEDDQLRHELAQSLPPYMVPALYRWQRQLPLTANSKIDRKALTAVAGQLDVADLDYQAPRTATEQRLADAWSTVLGIPAHQIGRQDSFFDRGGTSLSAVKLAIVLKRAVSLKDLLRHPVLADLAEFVDGRSERRVELLQLLSKPEGPAREALVCFPYAGGNAVSFQPLAKALSGSGMAVYAVELPGHDVSADSGSFEPLTRVVERVTAEITAAGLGKVLLWGHSSGAAFALATAAALQSRGVEVQRVFFAAQLLGNAATRRAAAADLTLRSDAEIGASLADAGGYSELAALDAQRVRHAGAAYRHDCTAAHRYLAGILEAPPVERLSAPVTVVVAADDPSTAGFAERYRELEQVAEHVDLHELVDGGHYFLRSRPVEAARAVLAAELLTSSAMTSD